MSNKMKLADMGTTGLVEWVVSGNPRMRGARMGKAVKVIAARVGRWEAVNAFRKAVNARESYRTNPSIMKRAEYVAARFAAEYCWLQAVGVDNDRALPWVCVDCRTGTIHTFKNSDDARAFAASEGIEFYL